MWPVYYPVYQCSDNKLKAGLYSIGIAEVL